MGHPTAKRRFEGELIEQKGDFSIVLFDYQRDPAGNYKF